MAKAKSAAPRTRQPKFVDEKYLGTEPLWDGWENWPIKDFHRQRSRVGQYYNHFYTGKDLKPNVVKLMEKLNYSKEDVNAFKASDDWRLNASVAGYATALLRGMPGYHPTYDAFLEELPGVTGTQRNVEDYVKETIDELIEIGRTQIEQRAREEAEQEALKVNRPVLTIQQRLHIAAYAMTDDIEEALDSAIADPAKFDIANFKPQRMLHMREAKPAHAKIIKQFYTGPLEELNEVCGPKKKDNEMYDQLIEGYAHYTPKQRKLLQMIYQSIVGACDMIIESGKATRKPRKKKPTDKTKAIAKLKYQKEDSDLKLVSVNPIDIIGAKELWVYNTKTRKLGKYVVADDYNTGVGLSVKGTSIINYSESASVQKTLRKPAEQIAEFKKAGKVALRKFLDDIKAVETKLNGRFNEQTIILKVAK
jgi:hypothetical protein